MEKLMADISLRLNELSHQKEIYDMVAQSGERSCEYLYITILSDIATQYYNAWLEFHRLSIVPRLVQNNLYNKGYLNTNGLRLNYTSGKKNLFNLFWNAFNLL